MGERSGRTIVEAAKAGAIVWAICGVVEAVAIEGASALATGGHGIALAWIGFEHPWRDLGLATACLALCSLAGALAAAAAAALVIGHPATRRLASRADRHLLWRSVAGIELACAYAVHAAFVGQPALAPAVVVTLAACVLGLVAAWNPRLSHRDSVRAMSLGFPIALVIGAFASCRWPSGEALPRALAGAAAACTGLAAMTAAADRARFRRGAIALLAFFAAMEIVGATAFPGPTATGMPARPARPNVLLITLDTVRADHLSIYGYQRETTPKLGALPVTTYERQVASSNWTAPTHASILTGQSPRRHGLHRSAGTALRGLHIDDRSTTLAEILRNDGYDTRAIVANTAVLLPALGFSRGFDLYELPIAEGPVAPVPDRYLLQSPIRRALARAVGEPREYASAAEINRLANDAIEDSRRGGKPFFLWLNYMDAHAPYAPPAPFDRRYPGKDPSFDWSGFTDLIRDVAVQHSRALTPREADHLASQYDGAIAHLDEELGRLFERLRALGVYDNTLVIVTGDHGEALGEKALLAHGRSLDQSQVWVPLLIKYPGQTRRATVTVSTSDTDILPTVLDVVGCLPAEGTTGRSLRSTVPLGGRWVTAESYEPRGPGFTSPDGGPDEMALFAGMMKLIVGASGGLELYDLQADPGERDNLAGRRHVPKAWMRAIGDAVEDARRFERPPAPVDEDLLERLRSLNYIR